MPQLLLPDNIPIVLRASSTTCTLASTYLGQPTRITVGGQQYKLSSTLTLNTATTGLGGLDTGALAANTLYYIYFCVNSSGTQGLVASTAAPSTGPTGFTTRNKVIGRMRTQLDAASITAVVPDLSLGLEPLQKTRETYTPTLSWNTNVSNNSGLFQWVQNNIMRVQVRLSVNGAPNAAALTFTLPAGYNVDVNSFFGSGANSVIPGIANSYDTSVNILFQGVCAWNNTDPTNVIRADRLVTSGTGQDITGISNVSPMTWASGDVMVANIDVFVAEWVGLFT